MPGCIRLPQVGVNGVIGHQLQGFELHAVPALQQDRLGSRQPAHRDGGSSRVVTQSLGHIARGEPIKLVDGGRQRRSFTDVSDGVSALMRIIENPQGRASGQIYNIGNPCNDLSVRDLAKLMLDIAKEFPEYRPGAERTELIEVSSGDYYGKGYQDIQTRVPWIGNTTEDLDWTPRVGIRDALREIFAAYQHEVADARALIDD